jgi:hypothetical protein
VRVWPLFFWTLTPLATGLLCGETIIDFEGLPDSTFLSNQYPGLTFFNAQIATAGISLNELEFPPHSGVNVVVDVSGPISILFATPVSSVGGYFTYASLVTLTGYDTSSNLISSAASAFNTNEALSGEAGSSPNEFMQVSSGAGIARLTITGEPTGSSFAMDDLVYQAEAVVIPEPSTLKLAGSACLLALAAQFIKKRSSLIHSLRGFAGRSL